MYLHCAEKHGRDVKKTRQKIEGVKLQLLGWQKCSKMNCPKCPIFHGHPKLAIMVQIRPYLKQYPNLISKIHKKAVDKVFIVMNCTKI